MTALSDTAVLQLLCMINDAAETRVRIISHTWVTSSIWNLQMDCNRTLTNVVNLNIHCIACSKSEVGLDTYRAFSGRTKTQHTNIFSDSVGELAVALCICCKWPTGACRLPATVRSHWDSRPNLTLGIMAKCWVLIYVWPQIYSRFWKYWVVSLAVSALRLFSHQ